MVKVSMVLLLALSAVAQDDRWSVRTFTSDRVKVRVVEDKAGIMPLLEGVAEGDGAIVSVFFYEIVSIGGKPMRLLRSRVSLCPVAPGAGSGCDYIEGLANKDIEFVRVRVFRELFTVDVGRRPEK